jgi:hypothetical protein
MSGVTGSDVTPLKIVLVLFLFLGNSRKERTRKRKRTRTMAEELTSLPVAPTRRGCNSKWCHSLFLLSSFSFSFSFVRNGQGERGKIKNKEERFRQ